MALAKLLKQLVTKLESSSRSSAGALLALAKLLKQLVTKIQTFWNDLLLSDRQAWMRCGHWPTASTFVRVRRHYGLVPIQHDRRHSKSRQHHLFIDLEFKARTDMHMPRRWRDRIPDRWISIYSTSILNFQFESPKQHPEFRNDAALRVCLVGENVWVLVS